LQEGWDRGPRLTREARGASTAETMREGGLREYEQALTRVARRADALDLDWPRFKSEYYGGRIIGSFEREWYALYEPRAMPGMVALASREITGVGVSSDLVTLSALATGVVVLTGWPTPVRTSSSATPPLVGPTTTLAGGPARLDTWRWPPTSGPNPARVSVGAFTWSLEVATTANVPPLIVGAQFLTVISASSVASPRK